VRTAGKTQISHSCRVGNRFIVAHQIPTQNPFHAAGGGANGGQNTNFTFM